MSIVRKISNFFDDPELELALSSELRSQDVFDGEKTFKNIKVDINEYSKKSWETILPKDKYELNLPAFFRVYKPDEKEPTYIHSDAMEGDLTLIVYLNRDNRNNGLAIWRHNDGNLFVKHAEHVAKYNSDGLDERNWSLVEVIRPEFNTAILLPSNVFHSRYPRQNWDVGLDKDRLIKVYFLKEAI